MLPPSSSSRSPSPIRSFEGNDWLLLNTVNKMVNCSSSENKKELFLCEDWSNLFTHLKMLCRRLLLPQRLFQCYGRYLVDF